MNPSYVLMARQQLSASPRLQQAVRLLQLSTAEFEEELREQLATNPFLEEETETPEAGATPPATAPEPVAEAKAESEPEPLDIPDLGDDWDEPAPRTGSGTGTSADGDEDHDLSEWACAPRSLREDLREQLLASRVDPRERVAAEVVIDSLDDDGYLRQSLSEAAQVLNLEPPLSASELDAGLQLVQGFEPAGVGARDLSECLALQVRAHAEDTPGRALALHLVRGHLVALARHDYAGIARVLDCDDAAIAQAHALIRRLDPHPGLRRAPSAPDYVVPDVIVRQQGEELTVTVNPATRPRLRLNQMYADLLRRARHSANPALAQQLQEARWLLRNAEQRFVTIHRVASAIVARQRAFFTYGEIALKPLVLREVAEELGLHESTVSRATARKYMSTPRGLFEFKHFFSRQLATKTGGSCSAAAVQVLIKEMIAAEPANAPLSDVTLAELLGQHGVRVARRTVTKYRTQMRVPPAELRRQA